VRGGSLVGSLGLVHIWVQLRRLASIKKGDLLHNENEKKAVGFQSCSRRSRNNTTGLESKRRDQEGREET